MKSVFKKSLPAILAGTALMAASAAALAADPATMPNDDIQKQLNELQAKVSQLQEQQKQSEQATISSVLSDAHNRSQLLADGADITSGYDKGFFLQSADKTFTLKPGFVFQVRNATNWRQDAKNGGTSDDIQNGWEIRRVKLYASGNMYGPDVTYGIQLTNNRNAATIELDDVWVQWRFQPHFAVKAGQYKGPFSREELVSDSNQIAVERSLLNEVLGGGQTGPRAQGVSLIAGAGGEDLGKDPFRAEIMWEDGDGTPNTNFQDTSGTTPDTRPDFGAIGRVDYKFFGDWNNLNKMSAKTTKDDLLVLGGAVAVSGNQGNNNYRGTVDVMYQGLDGKLGVYGAGIVSYTDFRNTAAGAEDTRTDYGALIQAGYLVAPEWEPFVRADMVWIDDDFIVAGAGGDNGFPELTVGVAYYFGKDGSAFNRAKLTLDATYLPSGAPGDRTGTDELNNGGRNEIVVRAQMQFAI